VTRSREARQLELIHEFTRLAAETGNDCWLRGGWALDFLLGRVTRAHEDIDLFIWADTAPRLLPKLKEKGYEEVGGPPPEQQRNLTKDGEEFHVTLLEENELGVVTAGGRWAHLPWPKGMLEGPIGQIGDVRCRGAAVGEGRSTSCVVARATRSRLRRHRATSPSTGGRREHALTRRTVDRVPGDRCASPDDFFLEGHPALLHHPP